MEDTRVDITDQVSGTGGIKVRIHLTANKFIKDKSRSTKGPAVKACCRWCFSDKVFAAQRRAPFVAGEFVWSGFDHLG